MGFYTTRFVTAINPSKSETFVLDLLKSDPNLEVRKTKEAKIYFERIEKKRLKFIMRKQIKGFVFFKMRDADENGQHWDAREVEEEAYW